MSVRVRPQAAGAASGRHFLRSSALAADLVDAAGIAAGDLALDLGAGAGILAVELARRGARVVAVEIDAALAARVRERLPQAEVLAADALRVPLPREPFKVVANVPFGCGTAILRRLLDDPGVPLVSADVVLQWELATRRAAVWPSTLAGVLWGAWYDLSVVRRLPRAAFAPPPSIDAGILRAVRRAEPLVPPNERRAYGRFVAAGFDRGLRGVASPLELKRLGPRLGFARDARPRDLDARQWAALWRSVRVRR